MLEERGTDREGCWKRGTDREGCWKREVLIERGAGREVSDRT